jgi:signal transduction histidine kinase
MIIELAQTDKIRQEREELRQQLLGSVIKAQEEERRRISRELHDGSSQSLTSLIVGLRTLETTTDREEAISQARQLREIAHQTLEELHALAVQLRPTVLDDMGLLSALRLYAGEFQDRYAIQVEIQTIGIKNDRRLPPALVTTVYRVFQEALTNVAKYSSAHQVSVLLEQREHSFSLIIEDDGKGFDFTRTMRQASRNKQLGLYGMRERAAQLGGQLVVESNPGQGTTIYLRVPLSKEQE